MVIASVLALLLLLAPAIAAGQSPDAETERRRIEALLYQGDRSAAAFAAGRLVAQAATDPALARVGEHIRCHLLYLNYRQARSSERLERETARQVERAFTRFLASATATPTDRKARFLHGLFLQDRARGLGERNNVLHAAEIAALLRRSSAAFTAVIRGPSPGAASPGAASSPGGASPGAASPRAGPTAAAAAEAASLGRWSRVQLTINLYLLARVYSTSDRRRAPTLSMAMDRLPRLAEEFPGLPEGNRAYFYYGLALETYGAVDLAREVFMDLWRTLAWNNEGAPFLEETLWHICRLDRKAGNRAQVIAASVLLRRRLESIERPPTRFTVRILAAAACCRFETEGAARAAEALESTADWLEARGAPVTRELLSGAVRMFEAPDGTLSPDRHSLVLLLASRGLLASRRPREALRAASTLSACRSAPRDLRARAFRLGSRAWEGLGFLREALRAHREANRLDRREAAPDRVATLRRTASLLKRIAERSKSPLDRERARTALDRVPRPLGEREYESGTRAYREGDLQTAARWFILVPEESRFHALATALQGHVGYLLSTDDPDPKIRLRAVLSVLQRLDRLSPHTPNWLSAQAIRVLTQAQARRALGDLDGAAADLAHYEDEFTDRPALVAEALQVRVAVAVDQGNVDTARGTLEVLASRFPTHRSFGEACLCLARFLRTTARADADPAASRTSLLRSIRLRHRGRGVLGEAFTARHRYVLAVDEMEIGDHFHALELLEALELERPPELAPARDGITLRRVRCLMHLDRLPEAEKVIGALVARKPDHLAPLKLQAVLLGGTAVMAGSRVIEHRYLDRPVPAFDRWERIKAHAERVTPYASIWFEAQFHIALLNHWRGNTGRVRAIFRWIEVSGYEPFEDEKYGERLRWLAREVGWEKEEEEEERKKE